MELLVLTVEQEDMALHKLLAELMEHIVTVVIGILEHLG